MHRVVLGSLLAVTVAAAPAFAQQHFAGRDNSGTDPGGSSRCPTYGMNMNLTVNGSAISATFLQDGRTERNFTATVKPDGTFVSTATVGGGGKMRVAGKVTPGQVDVKLDGYCIFEFKLTPK